jgi:hypothetical protein
MERSPHCETSVCTACDTATFATMVRCPPFVVRVGRSVFVANVANVASPTLKKREARPRLATARYSVTAGQDTIGHVVEVCGTVGVRFGQLNPKLSMSAIRAMRAAGVTP